MSHMDDLQDQVSKLESIQQALVRHTIDGACAANMEWVIRYADRLDSLANELSCLAGRVLQANELHRAPPE